LSGIAGASIFLYSNEEYDKIDFRQKLIIELEKFCDQKNYVFNAFDMKRLKTIIYETSLYDPTNRRPVKSKHYTEIDEDSNYYSDISKRAKRILKYIK